MVRRPDLVEAFERALLRRTPVDHQQNLQIVGALYEEARALGIFPLQDPLDGIEVDIRLAKALNLPVPPDPAGLGR